MQHFFAILILNDAAKALPLGSERKLTSRQPTQISSLCKVFAPVQHKADRRESRQKSRQSARQSQRSPHLSVHPSCRSKDGKV